MTNNLFDDCTYIGINSSPRSDTLPRFYNLRFLDFNLGINIKTTIPNILNIMPRLRKMKVSTSRVLIEYDGNLILNFLLILKLFSKDLYIDCHNCAVENEDGKATRYCINLIYLYCLKILFKANLVVHNDAIMEDYPLDSIVVNTPYPNLDRYISTEKNNDVVFSCSLNSDEPIEAIILACQELEKQGYKVRITGNFKKLSEKIQAMGAPFFSGYISKESYFKLLGQSKVMVCLTSRKKTLLYSPREGISLGLKVLMTSSQINKDFFGEQAIYIDLEDDLAEEVINAVE